ncbi:MAG: bifunctional diaminohydroxyphosphoribosylaminopyrimidine deaminase/5-amino-6-(5-phosphoribosylamino)uracil reductase RibD [Nitrospirae bacterium]|nr:bifunctional diaminohydroxyphosphoribosylaminopyrimidine deaminase/5-amino-6-(5-phosphoribosylamino)uracil reductase RibD [Nitrospirota bacterium]MBI5695577.1 bifunctional diaminohydroxyphosphoribosylaminopyrimidine deaminase/5-amino-6-(5-phosphoribosylamino)uracil reductase RibD [Nitrospirota bacterium]
MDDKNDEKYMDMALSLAELGRGTASPNPMVGAVVVKDGKVVGKGWHKRPGTPHAEAIALRKAGDKAEGSTIYVNLEPCCHRDKLTPPCTDALIASKVARVVVGMVDPNPKVAGKGIDTLREAGIEVELGLLAERCEKLNTAFAKHITTGLPSVTLKVAQTLDGKIATSTGESKWITGPDARRAGHLLRDQSDAIVVGIGTVLRDDPALTTRLEGEGKSRDPHRIIMDSHLRIPLDAKVLNVDSKSKTYVATTVAASTQKMKELKRKKAELLIIDADPDGRVSMPLLMEELAKMGMTNILIEGGARVNAEALRSNVVDRVMFFIAPKILGGDDARGSIGGRSPESLVDAVQLHSVHYSRVGEDILIEGYIMKEGPEASGAVSGEPQSEQPQAEDRASHKRRRRKSRKGKQG